MSIDKFGRVQNISTGESISLSYLVKYYQRKGEVSKDLRNYVEHCFERYVPRKQVVTLWAETRDSLTADDYEWSFGGRNRNGGQSGYTMIAPGRLIGLGLSTGGVVRDDTGVTIVVNERTLPAYQVYKGSGSRSAIERFRVPLELNTGDVINFRTLISGNARGGVITALIELDF